MAELQNERIFLAFAFMIIGRITPKAQAAIPHAVQAARHHILRPFTRIDAPTIPRPGDFPQRPRHRLPSACQAFLLRRCFSPKENNMARFKMFALTRLAHGTMVQAGEADEAVAKVGAR
jgi:hypothetical protein